MKPIYMLGTVVMICLAVIGAAGAIFLFNTEEEADAQKERTTEELAADLDEALGVDPPAEKKTPENNNTDSEQKESENNSTTDQTPAPDTENNDSMKSRDASSSEQSDWKQNARESNAISLGSEEESISVDELLQRMEE